MRRFLLPIILGIALIGIALAIYILFFSAKVPELSVEEGASFGVSGEYVPGQVGEAGEGIVGEMQSEAGTVVAPSLIKITDGPVAFGVAAFPASSTSTQEDTEIRYLERASGNAYGYKVGERTLTRLSNQTLPGVYEAAWTSDGSRAYARFLSNDAGGEDTIETYVLPLTEGEQGYFLEPGIAEVVVKEASVATLLPTSVGSVATLASLNGANIRTLFTSPLALLELLPAGSGYTAYTSPSAHSGGYGFSINNAGTFERIAGPLRGLTLLPSPSGAFVLSTYLSGTTLRTELIEMSSRTATPIPLGALSEKCVWANDEESIYCAVPRSVSGTIPDDWYQGAVSFSDRIWKVDLGARVAILVVDPLNTAQVAVDAVSLAIDEEENVLVFTNKKDGSLWVYDL